LVIENSSPHEHATTLVRPVDALERLFYRYSERNPTHFVLVAEFGEVLTAHRVGPALTTVQRRHPLLSAHVEDRPATRLGFYRAPTVAPIELTVRRGPESNWQAAAARSSADRSTVRVRRSCVRRCCRVRRAALYC
jgi:hypothetical protein